MSERKVLHKPKNSSKDKLAYNRWYLQNHREQVNAQRREYYKTERGFEKAMEYIRNYNKRHIDDHRNYQKLWMRLYRQKIKHEVLLHYSNGELKCACCGESNYFFMTIDHIMGRGKTDREAGQKRSGWRLCVNLKMRGYPDGYQVLCYNCNLAKGHYGSCPHERT